MPFNFFETGLPGVLKINPSKYADDRGFFEETYKASEFHKSGITLSFVQDNHSYSKANVLRGIHFQTGKHAQGKLVRALTGRIWDLAVDLRPDSRTFKKWVGVELDCETGVMLYIPPGFGHGFCVLSETAHVVYKATSEYEASADAGILWNDSALAIRWPGSNFTVSQKDSKLPELSELLGAGTL